MRKWKTVRVVVPADLSHTGKTFWKRAKIDACIADVVSALSRGGIVMRSSCCGHGRGAGEILLQDGRRIVILDRDFTFPSDDFRVETKGDAFVFIDERAGQVSPPVRVERRSGMILRDFVRRYRDFAATISLLSGGWVNRGGINDAPRAAKQEIRPPAQKARPVTKKARV